MTDLALWLGTWRFQHVNDRFRRRAVDGYQRRTDGGADRVRMSTDLDLGLEAADKAQSHRRRCVSQSTSEGLKDT